jgi:leucyl aminopeptidase
VHTLGRIPTKRIILVGLDDKEKVSIELIRAMTAAAARQARSLSNGSLSIALDAPALDSFDMESLARAVTEGALLGLYRFDRYRSKEGESRNELDHLLLLGNNSEALERGRNRGRIIAEAVNLSRDFANEPSNTLTPREFAQRTQRLAEENNLDCEILDRDALTALGMGAFLGVAKGSHEPPQLIVLRHRGGNEKSGIGFIGKGITFDTGGISIKPAMNMEAMKQDMSGGGAVIAAAIALARLEIPINITAIVPATENMPGGGAIKPGDILTAMNGKSIEVINTDAEGRLILADALSYANHLHLNPLIDVATLTGACAVALGDVAFGLMTNDEKLAQEIITAGHRGGERVWQLPMYEEYDEKIKSNIADVKNTGGRYGGAITAAKFLAKFTDGTSWAHLDIAGTDDSDKDQGVLVKGSTGVAVRTLIEFAIGRTEGQA